MPDTSNISFLDRVRAILSDLPASERRLAQFTLDFSGDLSSYNASELASLAQVSNATVTRLIRRLEYANYEAARKQIRTEKTDDAFTSLSQPLSAGEATLHAHLQDSYSKLGNTYRHPAVVANMAATVDHITGGRFVLGVGAGWLREEIVLLDHEPARRGKRMDEMIEIIRGFHSGEYYGFKGKYNLAMVVEEGAKVARQLLNMCIRGLDYCPPTDLDFSQFIAAVRAVPSVDDTVTDEMIVILGQTYCDGFTRGDDEATALLAGHRQPPRRALRPRHQASSRRFSAASTCFLVSLTSAESAASSHHWRSSMYFFSRRIGLLLAVQCASMRSNFSGPQDSSGEPGPLA